jgi:hypothetical protein
MKALDIIVSKLFITKLLQTFWIKGKEYHHEGWLNLLRIYPHLIKGAIVIKDKKF